MLSNTWPKMQQFKMNGKTHKKYSLTVTHHQSHASLLSQHAISLVTKGCILQLLEL